MQRPGQPDDSNPESSQAAAPSRPNGLAAYPPVPRLRTVRIYQTCDSITESLIYAAVLFSPWAFGTTQPWSLWTMTVAGCLLGVLLLVKLFIRWFKNYRAPRWGGGQGDPQADEEAQPVSWANAVTAALAVLTVLILSFCFISALNARSTYRPEVAGFDYRHYLTWLPHSYDSQRSWLAFWHYLGLALAFWAVRDWLLGKSVGEERAARMNRADGTPPVQYVLPARLRRLLWVLCVNGALLGLVGIATRLSGTDKLLWLVQPRIPAGAFGPYNYQSNAAQFFNLVWPVCLGFWWTMRRGARHGIHPPGWLGRKSHHWLLLCVVVTALCPLLTNSRGGAIIAAANAIITTAILLLGKRRGDGLTKLGILFLFIATLLAGLYFSWGQLGPRLEELDKGFKSRESICVTARDMARDCPLFGTGPGTFEPLFQLYRHSPNEYWPAQLHNDWLETLITFGWVGSTFIGLALLAVLGRWFCAGGIRAGWRFTALLWLALAGCLVHARFDFPFQVHSLLFLFLQLCAILFTLSRRP